eukprot:jgi/Undpi1/6197/HiC_scaffold_20.g08681.m1
MGLTALLAFALAASPATIPHKADSHAKKHYGTVHRRSPLMANLGVCTEQDCLQQGAPRTLAKLKKVAKGTGIKVDSCRCLGMCGLGPCVSIDWPGSRMESRGGIDADDDITLQQLVDDAVNPPAISQAQEQDPYAEQ